MPLMSCRGILATTRELSPQSGIQDTTLLSYDRLSVTFDPTFWEVTVTSLES